MSGGADELLGFSEVSSKSDTQLQEELCTLLQSTEHPEVLLCVQSPRHISEQIPQGKAFASLLSLHSLKVEGGKCKWCFQQPSVMQIMNNFTDATSSSATEGTADLAAE